MFNAYMQDLNAVIDRDPAAKSKWEVIFLYPGFRAVRAYRLAHWLYCRGRRAVALWLSHRARRKTGIEIHPGAKLGPGVFIDHGIGVVIGETAEIGKNCTLYQGVTLGGTGKDTGKRHPTLGDGVLVGAGAKVLGPITVGDGAKIGAGAVVVKPVPAGATVTGVPGKVVKTGPKAILTL